MATRIEYRVEISVRVVQVREELVPDGLNDADFTEWVEAHPSRPLRNTGKWQTRVIMSDPRAFAGDEQDVSAFLSGMTQRGVLNSMKAALKEVTTWPLEPEEVVDGDPPKAG